MRKVVCIVLTAMLVLSVAAVFAADNSKKDTVSQPAMQMPMTGKDQQAPAMKEPGMMGEGMMGRGMMGEGMMGHGKMGCPMMEKGKMGCQMEKKIVATQDGGVVVWIGNKLIKYDKNLKLVNEVELKVDFGAMKHKMMENCQNTRCPGTDAHAMDPYHHRPGTTQPASEDVDAHTLDPYHHAP